MRKEEEAMEQKKGRNHISAATTTGNMIEGEGQAKDNEDFFKEFGVNTEESQTGPHKRCSDERSPLEGTVKKKQTFFGVNTTFNTSKTPQGKTPPGRKGNWQETVKKASINFRNYVQAEEAKEKKEKEIEAKKKEKMQEELKRRSAERHRIIHGIKDPDTDTDDQNDEEHSAALEDKASVGSESTGEKEQDKIIGDPGGHYEYGEKDLQDTDEEDGYEEEESETEDRKSTTMQNNAITQTTGSVEERQKSNRKDTGQSKRIEKERQSENGTSNEEVVVMNSNIARKKGATAAERVRTPVRFKKVNPNSKNRRQCLRLKGRESMEGDKTPENHSETLNSGK